MLWRAVPALAVSLLFAGGPALAQDIAFPEEAMDALMRVTMAQSADAQCDGISARNLRVQAAMLDMLTTVRDLGSDPVAAVEYLKTEEGAARVAEREAALRAKHGAEPEGVDGLCATIRAEAKQDRDLARLVRIR